MTAYKEAAGPLETPGKRLSLARQTSLAVGTLLIAAAALAAWVAPVFLWLVALVALDRMIAGTTGHGAIEWILEKLPWNRHAATESEAAALANTCAAELVPACAAEDPTD